MYIKKIKKRHLKNINNIEIAIKRDSLTIPYILYTISYNTNTKKKIPLHRRIYDTLLKFLLFFHMFTFTLTEKHKS